MWRLRIIDQDFKTEHHENVALAEDRYHTKSRTDRQRTLVARAQNGELIRALLLRDVETGSPTFYQFTETGIIIAGIGGSIRGDKFYRRKSTEEWHLDVQSDGQ